MSVRARLEGLGAVEEGRRAGTGGEWWLGSPRDPSASLSVRVRVIVKIWLHGKGGGATGERRLISVWDSPNARISKIKLTR